MSATGISQPATQLREILALLSTAAEDLASEWEFRVRNESPNARTKNGHTIVSHTEHELVKVVLAAVGSLESMIVDPYVRLTNLSTLYMISRALHIAAENDIAEHLAEASDTGVSIVELSMKSGMEENKLRKHFEKPPNDN